MPKFAVIDLGTNTFHLLIVESTDGNTFGETYRERRFVKLAEEGIDTIGDAAFERGLSVISGFQKRLKEFDVCQVRAIGTAALRTASNGVEFISLVKKQTGLDIELIDGQEEARFIHLGIAQAVPMSKELSLIMDIGGGSVEFIFADNQKVYWAQSFPIGIAILFHQFPQSDSITSSEIKDIEHFLFQNLQPFLEALKEFQPARLIGASGAFEVVENMLIKEIGNPIYFKTPADNFFPLYQKIIHSTANDRLEMENLPADRADLIVVAFILIHFVLHKSSVSEIVVAAYALKEGVLMEMMK